MSGTKLGHDISLLTPFRNDGQEGRLANWTWLKAFWAHALPGAELVVGEDRGGVPFSKSCAVNDAFRRSHGDVVVLLDADCYIAPGVILECARQIRWARIDRERLWFVPYRHLYRLTKEATANLIASDVTNALRFSTPPDLADVGPIKGSALGHWFGALIQIMPREAFADVGGMDVRFRGWGGEDVTFVRVLDTLYATHRTSQNDVLTLWHPVIGDTLLREWEGQTRTGVNNVLSVHYRAAYRNPDKMRAVTHEWLDDPQYARFRIDAPQYPNNASEAIALRDAAKTGE